MAGEHERTLVHLPQADGSWRDAEIAERLDGGRVLLRPLDASLPTAEADGATLQLVNELPEQGVEDMTQLTHLHEAAIVHNLGHRERGRLSSTSL